MNCMGRECPTYKDCFYYRARRRMQHAQILVVNHALFFSDLALRRQGASILPDYDVVVFDEAHNLERVAGDHLGVHVTSGQVDYVLSKLYNDRTNRGLLVHHKLGEAQRQVLACRYRADDFFDAVDHWLSERNKTTARVAAGGLFENELSPALAALARALKQSASKVGEDAQLDFTAASDRVQTLADLVDDWCQQQEPGAVYWIEAARTRRGRRRIMLASAPLDVGPALREQLFDKVSTVVLTSATLAVGQPPSFDFFKSRIGLTQVECRRWGSPFDYAKQAELVLVDGMPDPADKEPYEAAAAAMIRRYVARTDGRAFVLFTSYEMMRRLAARLTPWLAQQNLALLDQSDGTPRSQMIERFRANPRSVLLGTDSFWQGVDVAGDALHERDHHEAAVQRARPAAVGSPAGSHSRRRRQPVRRLPTARGGAQAQAGLRPADPHAPGPRHGRDSRPAGAHETLRAVVPRLAARVPPHGGKSEGRSGWQRVANSKNTANRMSRRRSTAGLHARAALTCTIELGAAGEDTHGKPRRPCRAAVSPTRHPTAHQAHRFSRP